MILKFTPMDLANFKSPGFQPMAKLTMLALCLLGLLFPDSARAKEKTCKKVDEWFLQAKYKHNAFAGTVGASKSKPGFCYAAGGPVMAVAKRMAVSECQRISRARFGDKRRCKVVKTRSR